MHIQNPGCGAAYVMPRWRSGMEFCGWNLPSPLSPIVLFLKGMRVPGPPFDGALPFWRVLRFLEGRKRGRVTFFSARNVECRKILECPAGWLWRAPQVLPAPWHYTSIAICSAPSATSVQRSRSATRPWSAPATCVRGLERHCAMWQYRAPDREALLPQENADLSTGRGLE